MSKIYKRPMFRKGGEVMEGIMTGIKPRKKFNEGTKPPLEKLQGQLSLVDQLAGGTGVSPVSQLLISGGLNLLGGVGAGGTKLQELAAAFKQPSEQLFKNMAGERAQKRALAASLVAKMDNKKLDAQRKAAFLVKRKPGESEADYNSRLRAKTAQLIKQEPSVLGNKTYEEYAKDLKEYKFSTVKVELGLVDDLENSLESLEGITKDLQGDAQVFNTLRKRVQNDAANGEERVEQIKELYELEVADRDSARKREIELAKAGKEDYMHSFTGIVGLLSFCFMIYAVVYLEVPENNKEVFINILGISQGIVLSIFGFYYGSAVKGNK
jgi:hypothetical protein